MVHKKETTVDRIRELLHTPPKPKVRQRATVAALLCGPVALVGVVGLHMRGALDSPPDPETGAYITLYDRVNDWSEDFVGLWLAGTKDNADTLKKMVAPGVEPDLPDAGYTVNKIRTYVVDDGSPGGEQAHFTMEARVQVVAPGGRGVELLTYQFGVIGYHDTFTAQQYPFPVNTTRVPYTLNTKYTETEEVDSVLGKAVSNFAAAYMTPKEANGSLANITGPDFDAQPVAKSLWKQTDLVHLAYYGGTTTSAKPGTELGVLATVKAVTSSSTYSLVQLPVTVKMQDNGQWLVTELDKTPAVAPTVSENSGTPGGSEQGQ